MGFKYREYGLGFLLAVTYVLVYLLLRRLSVDQFYLPAGLRFACFLRFPVKYWPFLVLGDCAAVFCTTQPVVEYYGLTWSIGASMTMWPSAAMAALAAKKKANLLNLNVYGMLWVLAGASLSVCLATSSNMASIKFLMQPYVAALGDQELLRSVITKFDLAPRFMLGDFVGVLVATPIALLTFEYRWLIHSKKFRLSAAIAAIFYAALVVAPVFLDTDLG